MDPKSPHFQWALPNSTSKFFDNKDGYIQEGLGSSLSGNSNRRGMKFTGTTTSYKCIGNEGSKTSFASISQAFSNESYSFPNRQCNSLVSSCEDGGVPKTVFNRISKINLELSPAPWDHHYCRISSKLYECGSRLAVKKLKRPFRVETPSTSISDNLISKENQRWIFLLLDCQHSFHGTLHGNQILTVRERMQCSKSGPISTLDSMLSHLFQ